MAKKSVHVGGQQLPLIVPESSWQPPTELPDLRRLPRIALDRETRDNGLARGLAPGWAHRDGHVCGSSVAWEAGGQTRSMYVPLAHPDTECFDKEQYRQWELDHVRAGVRFVMQNAPYDLGWGRADLDLPCPEKIDDTSCMAFMVDENRYDYTLNSLARWRGVPGKDDDGLREAAAAYGFHGDREIKSNIHRMPARFVGPYAEQDARALLPLADSLMETMRDEGTVEAYQLEMDIIPLVQEMRWRGVRVDLDAAERGRDWALAERDRTFADLTDRLGEQVGMEEIGRTAWLERVFTAARIAFPRTAPSGRFPSGQPSFTAGSTGWMQKHPHWLPQLIVRADKHNNVAVKFLQGFILDYAHRGRLHASINQYRGEDNLGTRTFRFSYSDPALQQMPSPDRDEVLGRLVRCCFLAEVGERWCRCDYCHDDQTEILTDEGWVLFPELGDQRVAQWHAETGEVDFVVPLDKYVGPVRTREMTHIKSKRVDALVTADHRCLLTHRETGEYIELPARLLTEKMLREEWLLPQTTQIGARPDVPVSDELLRLVAALQADAADRPQKYGNRDWVFMLKKPRKLERLVELLEKLGVQHVVTKHDDGRTRVGVEDDARFRELLSEGKTFSVEQFMKLSRRQMGIFVEELFLWDGSRYAWGGGYGSSNKSNVDLVSALATLAGYHVKQHKWKKQRGKLPYWQIDVRREYARRVRGGTRVVKRLTTGRVYCVTVPSSYIVTRRCGKVMVGGQSQQEFRLWVHFAVLLGLRGAREAAQKYVDDPRTDFHQLVADITGLERKPAKDTNFAKGFGAGVPKFASMTNKTLEEAAKIMEQYDTEMPFVSLLNQRCQKLANNRGYIRLLDGARSHFDEWEPSWREEDEPYQPPVASLAAARAKWGPTRRLRRAYTKDAMNRLIQGSAARQTKMAMRAGWREGIVPLLQVHDDLSRSCATEQDGLRLAEVMRDVVELEVPVVADADFGSSWGDAEHSWEDAVQKKAAE